MTPNLRSRRPSNVGRHTGTIVPIERPLISRRTLVAGAVALAVCTLRPSARAQAAGRDPEMRWYEAAAEMRRLAESWAINRTARYSCGMESSSAKGRAESSRTRTPMPTPSGKPFVMVSTSWVASGCRACSVLHFEAVQSLRGGGSKCGSHPHALWPVAHGCRRPRSGTVTASPSLERTSTGRSAHSVGHAGATQRRCARRFAIIARLSSRTG